MSSGLLAAILLFGLGLRLYHIDLLSLWDDEGYSVALLGRDFWRIAADTPLGNMPFYYYLIAIWTALAGTSEFAIRYLSLWFGILLIPLSCALARGLFGRKAILPAAILAALVPPLIYQSQSARTYTLLPALFAANLLLALRLFERPGKRLMWLGFAATAALPAFTHYYGLVIPVVACLILLPKARHDRRFLYGLVTVVCATLLALLPWLLSHLHGIAGYAGGYGYWDQRDLLRRAIGFPVHFWVGVMGQVEYGFDPGPRHLWTVVPLAAMAGGTIVLLRSSRTAHKLIILAYFAVPFLTAMLVSLYFVIFNPKYLLYLSPLCLALIAGSSVSPTRWLRWAGLLAIGATIVLWFPVIRGYYEAPAREDLRPLARRVLAQAVPGDALVINSDWRGTLVDHYVKGAPQLKSYRIPLEATPDEATVRRRLEEVMAQSERVWLVVFGAPLHSATHSIGPILSERYARVIDNWYGTTRLGLYVRGPLDERSGSTRALPAATFGRDLDLEMQGLAWPDGGEPLDSVTAAINWKALRALDRNFGASLRLIDKGGRVWAQADGEPGNGGLHTKGKAAGEGWRDQRGLLVPAGTPPGDYDLILAVYDQADSQPLDVRPTAGAARAQALLISSIRVNSARRPPNASLLPMSISKSIDYNGQVALIGGSWPPGIKAGEAMGVQIYWQAAKALDRDYRVVLSLRATGGHAVASLRSPFGGSEYPASRWSPREVIRQIYDLPVSPLAPGGTYHLEAAIEDAASSAQLPVSGGDTKVGAVTIHPRPRTSAPPVQNLLDARLGPGFRLLGYSLQDDRGDLPPANPVVQQGKTVKVYLYWRWEPANDRTIDRSYTAFVHLLNEQGVLAAQHDGIPVSGEVPTTSWPTREVIVDAHPLPIGALKPGRYSLIAGLYDSQTIDRLKTPDGRDHAGLGGLAIGVTP